MRRFPRQGLAMGGWAFLLLVVGCSVELIVPDESQISCDSSAQCPSGFVCLEAAQQCVRSYEKDPPSVGAVAISPEYVRVATPVRVSFDVSEPLLTDPALRLEDPVGGTSITIENPTRDGLTYVYTYIPAGSESQIAWDVLVSLTDKAGNALNDHELGQVIFDFEPPNILSVESNQAIVGADPLLTITVTADEPLGLARVTIVDGAELTSVAGISPEVWEASYVATGAETQGPRTVLVHVEDLAGNAAELERNGLLAFDFSKPALDGPATIETPFARAGISAAVSFRVTEPLVTTPPATVELFYDDGSANGIRLPMALEQEAGTLYTFARTLEGTDVDADYTVMLESFYDLAGNPGDATALGTIRLDKQAPSIVDMAVPGGLIPNAVYTVSFTVNEQLAYAPTVSLTDGAGTDLSLIPVVPAASGFDYTFEGQAPGTGGTSNFFTITTVLVDRAGNQAGINLASVEIDTAAPALTGLQVVPSSAKLGDLVRVVVSANELLSAPPTIVATAGGDTLTFLPTESAGGFLSYSYTYDVDGGELLNTPYLVQAFTLSDLAGNVANIDTSSMVPAPTLIVDTEEPTLASGSSVTLVSDNALNPSTLAKNGDRVTVTFTVSEIIAPPTVLMDSRPLTLLTEVPAGNEIEFTYVYDVDDAVDSNGLKSVTATLVDDVGNVKTVDLGVIRLDFLAPELLAGTPSRPRYKLGDQVIYVLEFSEDLYVDPTLTVLKGATTQSGMFGASNEGTGPTRSYISRTLVGGDDEVWTVRCVATDLAGNISPVLEDVVGGAFSVDTQPPQIAGITVATDYAQDDQLASLGAVITAGFSITNEALSVQDPQVRIGSTEMTRVGASLPYVYQSTVGNTEVSGVYGLTITATDDAGNVTNASGGPIIYDLDGPSVVAGSVGIQLVPATNNPLRTIASVTTGTTVRVSFLVTEALLVDPVVATTSPAAHALVKDSSSSGNAYTFRLDTAAITLVNGASYSIAAALTDLAGNSGAGDLGSFPADTLPPAAPDTSTVGAIVYSRVPWGSAGTAGLASFSVAGVSSAVEALSLVHIYDGPDPVSDSLLGSALADASGAFALALTRADHAAVHVSAIDTAGNESSVSLVEDVKWVATLGGKEPLSTLANPHRFVRRTWQPDAVDAGTAVELGEVDGIADIGGAWAQTSAAGTWRQMDPPDLLAGRGNHSMVFDASRGLVLVYGGYHDNIIGVYRDHDGYMWEWDGVEWFAVIPTDPEADGNPIDRQTHVMAYDASRGVTVMFGGETAENGTACHEGGGSFCGDTWEWNGSSWKLVDAVGWPGTRPDPRIFPSMAYDHARRRVVLFGGRALGANCDGDGAALCGAVWEWDNTTSLWTRIPTAAPPLSPTAREYQQLEYDSNAERVVLFGGEDDSINCDGSGHRGCNGIWEWDGQNWLLQATSSTEPGVNETSQAATAFDSIRNRLIVLANGQTWEWNRAASAWTNVSLSDPEGDGEPVWVWENHDVVYDSVRERTIALGGTADFDGYFYCDEVDDECVGVWEYDSSSWARRSSLEVVGYSVKLVAPSVRSDTAMAYDASRRRVVLFGGRPPPDGQLGDTWEWDGVHWQEVCASGCAGAPVARKQHAIVYDSLDKVVRLYGGHTSAANCEASATSWVCGGTFEWGIFGTPTCSSAADPCWREVTTAVGNPPPRYGLAMAYDAARDRTVMFGGEGEAGGACDTGPGNNWCTSTWEWGKWGASTCADGSKPCWKKYPPVAGDPNGRRAHAMTYDSAREVTVMHGGWYSSNCEGTSDRICGKTWEWAVWGSTTCPDNIDPCWKEAAPVGSPPTSAGPRYKHTLTYDEERRSVVMLSGCSRNTLCNALGSGLTLDAWEWDGSVWSRPDSTRVFAHNAAMAARTSSAAAFDSATGQHIVFGGLLDSTSSALADTWAWHNPTRQRAGHTWTVHFDSAGATGETVSRVDVAWSAAGIGYPGGVSTPGATLRVWLGGRWQDLSNNTVAPPGTGSFSACDPDTPVVNPAQPCLYGSVSIGLAGLLDGPQQSIHFGVVPLAVAGTGASVGVVATDYAQVTVYYTLR